MTTPSPPLAAPSAGALPVRSRLLAHLRAPLFREGYALVLNSGLTSVMGLVYWVIAARYYSAHAVGVNAAAISAMMFLAGVSQLNLMSALMRFLPVSGRGSTRFVATSYVVSGTISIVVALAFLAGLREWAPDLDFLTSNAWFCVWFVGATMAWSVFNLQDSVLTGLRAAIFVPVENLVFSVAKIALLVALAAVSPRFGVFASWTGALVFSLVPVSLLLFARLLPRHRRRADERMQPPTRAQVARFVSADYLGSLCWLASTALMPVIVVALAGPSQNAYFSLAWMIALPLYALSVSTGASLVVTGAGDEANVSVYARQVLVQTARLVVPVALGVALAAPYVLRIFGGHYSDKGATTLSLLALSAMPGMINALYVSVYRVRRTMRAVVAALAAQAVLIIGLGIVLLEAVGIAGVGVAWLVGQSVVAAAQFLIEPRALWARPTG
jgi:O-antigen/teichoic acid export membrane protein